ncbi:Kae1-associated serine/threonine protein kinase [Candidatus Woesearchaeota archaeon]|nr:Kae1-associated serine/threonine protein kinase [Candidatus Woesearchaeota archaeon]
MQKLIYQGAEAKIYRDGNKIIKERIQKDYRIPEIDSVLRKFRTKREEKVYRVLEKIGFPAPRVAECDSEKRLVIDFIEGSLVRDVLERKDYVMLSGEIGRKIAVLHNRGIIHGDLTTSNMVLAGEIYFIDFGLSFFSSKVEDRATDLHLLKEAFESTHTLIWEECFNAALESYEESAEKGKETVERLKKVEKRGRNKGK